MNRTKAPDGVTTSSSPLQESALQRQVDASARTAEAEAFMPAQYRASLSGVHPLNPYAVTVNPFLLQQEMLRRQEIEWKLAAASGLTFPGPDAELEILSQRENELIRLRNAHNQMMEAELMARSARDPMAAAGSIGGFPIAATADVRRSFGLGLGLGSITQETEIASRQRYTQPASAAQASASSESARLSADERDRLSEVADQAYRTVLAAKGLQAKSDDCRKMGDKDLAQEVELHENVQRRLMEEEALAEQQKKQAAAALRSDASIALERAELYRRQQQEEFFRLMQMQQFQLPGDDLLTLQSRIRGGIPMTVSNPYALGALPHLHSYHSAIPMIDPHAAAANIEKAYSAEGTPENDIIAKFLNVVTSRVPEIMDMLAYYFPVGIVDNAEKFHQEFPRVVDATLVELKMIQDRASKENGYKSRGLYDRVTNCIAAIGPYKTSMADLTNVASQATKQDCQSSSPLDSKKVASGKPRRSDSCKQTSPKMTASHVTSGKEGESSAQGIPDTWACHKCGNHNMASKARCSTCQGWKGGVRENKPKKRKEPTKESPESDQNKNKKTKKNKKKKSDLNPKNGSKINNADLPSKPVHVLLKKPDRKSKKAEQLHTKNRKKSDAGTQDDCSGKSTQKSKVDGVDHMDAANGLLLMVGASTTSGASSPSAES
eukprot:CCRYP_012838-RA/>CCRYP_012838-RA protein AED:0.04 eAED:0.04 QI:194/1/1/1/1/1/4/108/663